MEYEIRNFLIEDYTEEELIKIIQKTKERMKERTNLNNPYSGESIFEFASKGADKIDEEIEFAAVMKRSYKING